VTSARQTAAATAAAADSGEAPAARTPVRLVVRGKALPATVAALPFVKPGYRR